MTFEEAIVSVWQQTLVEKARTVTLGGEEFPVEHTARRELLQVDFRFAGRRLRGLEQNPSTKSRWAQLARQGKRVMQFLEGGQYVAAVVEGKVTTYGGKRSGK